MVAGTAACAGDDDPPQPSPSPSSASPTASVPSDGTPVPTATGSGVPPVRPSLLPGRYQPLWPFASLEAVRAWQKAYQNGGADAWHLDAERTALRFTRDHLGFTDIDRVTSRKIEGGDARIGVGYRAESRDATAAVLHLIRAGSGADAPWEVVGTDDAELSLTTPAYASQVTSPVRVGGRITGVDESLRVTVLRADSDKPLGTHCCVPAGGQNTPWSSTVSFTGSGVLTIVVSTGGHLQEIERFAITGVRS